MRGDRRERGEVEMGEERGGTEGRWVRREVERGEEEVNREG